MTLAMMCLIGLGHLTGERSMLNTITDMRVEAASLAAEGRQLSVELKKAIKRARRSRDLQKPAATTALRYNEYRNVYLEKMGCRKEARLHHLARMMLKGQDYHKVEAFTHHAVDADELYERVWNWDASIEYEFVLAWLNREPE